MNSIQPRVESTDDNMWLFVEDWECPFKDGEITVPAGFVTDGASIPRFAWTLFGHPMLLPRAKAAFRHDYQYTIGPTINPDPNGEERKQADKDFRDYQIELGVWKIKAYPLYWFVRLFGGSHWKVENSKKRFKPVHKGK